MDLYIIDLVCGARWKMITYNKRHTLTLAVRIRYITEGKKIDS